MADKSDFLLEKYKQLYETARHYDRMVQTILQIFVAIIGGLFWMYYYYNDKGKLVIPIVGLLVSLYTIFALLRYRFQGWLTRDRLAVIELMLFTNKEKGFSDSDKQDIKKVSELKLKKLGLPEISITTFGVILLTFLSAIWSYYICRNIPHYLTVFAKIGCSCINIFLYSLVFFVVVLYVYYFLNSFKIERPCGLDKKREEESEKEKNSE